MIRDAYNLNGSKSRKPWKMRRAGSSCIEAYQLFVKG